MSPRTKKNLLSAMECDALNSAKYSRFAARRAWTTIGVLPKAFQDAADNCRTNHFAKEARLDALINNDPDNLRNSIATEQGQIVMYRQFERDAANDGEMDVAAAFERIIRDKEQRCAEFQKILESLGIHSNFETRSRTELRD